MEIYKKGVSARKKYYALMDTLNPLLTKFFKSPNGI